MNQTYRLRSELEKIDTNLFGQLREKIGRSTSKESCFRKIMHRYVRSFDQCSGKLEKIGYDNLGIFINGLFCNDTIPEAQTEMEPDMVFYQKTPARIIFEMMKKVRISKEDVFFDIGSGMGQVVLLVNLTDVAFMNADSREINYSQGTLFFLYTSSKGKTRDQMTDLLRGLANKKAVRILTYGPCSRHFA